jgi:hypothetical protein
MISARLIEVIKVGLFQAIKKEKIWGRESK